MPIAFFSFQFPIRPLLSLQRHHKSHQINKKNSDIMSDELGKLLDEALDDFKDAPKTTDDDLDEYMQKVDDDATKKAAENFQSMLERMVGTLQNDDSGLSNSQATNSLSGGGGDQTITKTITDLLFDDAADEQELSRALAKLPVSKDSLDGLMETIIQTAVSKEAMYPAIKV
jgi:hypothetical protein